MCDRCQIVESNGHQALLHAPGTPLESCTPYHAHGITWGAWDARRWAIAQREWLRAHPFARQAWEQKHPVLRLNTPEAYGMRTAIPNYAQYDRHKTQLHDNHLKGQQ